MRADWIEMKFHIHGVAYELPMLDDATTKELKTIKEHTHMGLRSLMEGFYDMDPTAITAVVWLAKTRAGESVDWETLEDLRPLKDVEWPQPEDEDDEEVQSNPPSSTENGTSRTRGSRATSRSSRTTSTSPRETSTS